MDHAFMNNMNVYLLQHTLRSLCASSSSNENLNEKKMTMMKKKKKKNHHRNGNIIKKNKDDDMKHASSSSSSSWVYSVFWRILPRNYPPPKWDEAASGPVAFNERTKCNKRNWILVWEDGYCDFVACSNSRSRRREAGDDDDDDDDGDGYGDGEGDDSDGDDSDGGDGHGDGDGDGHGDCESLQPELFFKMSHDVYSYGEGVMGKVASENGHKWIFNRLQDDDYHLRKNTQAASILAGGGSPWQASMEAYPRTWEAQFKAGIQTIAIIAVGEGGLLQLGSTQKVEEDVEYVVRVQRRFHYLMQRSILAGAAGAGAGAAGGLFLYGYSLRPPPPPLYPPHGRHSQEQQKKKKEDEEDDDDEEEEEEEEEECGMKKKKKTKKKKRRMGSGVIKPAIPPPLPPISSSLQALLSKLPPVRPPPPPPPRPLRFTPAGQLI